MGNQATLFLGRPVGRGSSRGEDPSLCAKTADLSLLRQLKAIKAAPLPLNKAALDLPLDLRPSEGGSPALTAV